MMKWEYKSVEQTEEGTITEIPNELGSQGWELVCVLPTRMVKLSSGTIYTERAVFYFKRQVPEMVTTTKDGIVHEHGIE